MGWNIDTLGWIIDSGSRVSYWKGQTSCRTFSSLKDTQKAVWVWGVVSGCLNAASFLSGLWAMSSPLWSTALVPVLQCLQLLYPLCLQWGVPESPALWALGSRGVSPLYLLYLTQHLRIPHLWNLSQTRKSRKSGMEVVMEGLGCFSPCIFHASIFLFLSQSSHTKVGNTVRLPPPRIPSGKPGQAPLLSASLSGSPSWSFFFALCRKQPRGVKEHVRSLSGFSFPPASSIHTWKGWENDIAPPVLSSTLV